MSTFKNSAAYIFLFLLPKNAISSAMGFLVGIKLPKILARLVNQGFARVFRINISEAEKPLEDYSCIQELFVRKLIPGSRMVSKQENAIISPCDGFLSKAGRISEGQLIQAKGKNYSLDDLLADPKLAERFYGGHYATIYLSPKDYHRFHVPVDGEISQTIYVPGQLWPVNNWAVSNVDNLFCINERIISLIRSRIENKMLAHIAVGATMVGKIKLNYCSLESNLTKTAEKIEHKFPDLVKVEKGQELGRFMFGSTIILLFESGFISGFEKKSSTPVKMGETLGCSTGHQA